MAKITQDDLYNGQVVLVNKPRTWTSFDVVNKMRSDVRHNFQIPFVKIGHAGSLDPLASGLLIICIGRATKKIEQFQGLEKEYTGTIMLGATTPSYDFETPVTEKYSLDGITPQLIKEAAKKFVGAVWQFPPAFSAKKIDGKRAYDMARAGQMAEIKPVLVDVKKFEIVDVLLPMVEFRIICSKGTYIRSIAHDLGRQLGCGGVLASLQRTRIGKYDLKNASEVKEWMEALEPSEPKKRIPVKTAMKMAKERAKERKAEAGKKAKAEAKAATRKKTTAKSKPAKKKSSARKKK